MPLNRILQAIKTVYYNWLCLRLVSSSMMLTVATKGSASVTPTFINNSTSNASVISRLKSSMIVIWKHLLVSVWLNCTETGVGT